MKYWNNPNHFEENNLISKEGRFANIFFVIHKRPNQCIVIFPILDYSIQREEFIYEYLIINNLLSVKNLKLKMEKVMTNSYPKQISVFLMMRLRTVIHIVLIISSIYYHSNVTVYTKFYQN